MKRLLMSLLLVPSLASAVTPAEYVCTNTLEPILSFATHYEGNTAVALTKVYAEGIDALDAQEGAGVVLAASQDTGMSVMTVAGLMFAGCVDTVETAMVAHD